MSLEYMAALDELFNFDDDNKEWVEANQYYEDNMRGEVGNHTYGVDSDNYDEVVQ